MKIIQIIKQAIADSFLIWSRELKQVYQDMGVLIFFVIVPVVYPVLYATIYNTEAIHEVPMVVVDESHSSFARKYVRAIDATADVRVYAYAASLDEARAIVSRKEAYGILLIPSDFSWKIHRGEQATVGLYIDMSGLLFYKALLLAATEASLEGISVRRIYDLGIVAGDRLPVEYKSVAMYNTQSGFASFLLPAILILVLQQTLLLGISMLTTTAREKNQGRLIPPESIYGGTLRIISGKAVAYLTIYAIICVWALAVVPSMFRLPQLARYELILLFALPYLLASIFFSMSVATFLRGRETPMMVLVFTSLIFLFISGVSWPLSAIPEFWKYMGCLVPSTFGIQGFIKLNSMGASLQEITFEYQMLWLQTGVYFVITCLIYRYNRYTNKL
jgi:ABC-2 type transport system permease protein